MRVLRSQAAKAVAVITTTSNAGPTRRRRARTDPWTPRRKVNPNPNPRPRAPLPTHFTCRICIEEKPVDQFPQWVNARRGRWTTPLDVPYPCIVHLARNPRKKKINPVCKLCIGNSMSARLDMLGVRHIHTGCLEPGCTTPWPDGFIMTYLPAGAPLERYNTEMFAVWKTEHNPPLLTCPSPTCTAEGLPDPTARGYPQVSCHTCSFRSCAECAVPWHDKLTCAEFRAQRINKLLDDPERATLKLMQKKDARRCPNCGLLVEKDGGCDSMHCTGCSKFFNWSAAASAVVGARKPEPAFGQDMFGYRRPGDQAERGCEADSLEKRK